MVESRKAKIGNGLFAKAGFKKGDVIGVITGKIISDTDSTNSNYIEYGNEEVLYPALPYRHINHSCEPNCIFTIEINDEDKYDRTLFLEAIKNITPDEELFTDYAWEPEFSIPCECKSDNCRGWIINSEKVHLIEKIPEFKQGLALV